jgi:hypothetical protein
MGKATHPLTAADFQDAVVVALGELLKGGNTDQVHFRMVVAKTCALTGVAVGQFGDNEQTGKTWTECWVSWAFKALCEKGLGDKERKGWWKLTAMGKTAFKQLQGQNLDLTHKIKEEEDDDEVVAINEPSSAALSSSPVITPSGPLVDENGHGFFPPAAGRQNLSDPYLVQLVAAQAKCFRHYSSKSNVCSGCPIPFACYEALVQDFESDQILGGTPQESVPMGKLTAGKSKDTQTPEKILEASSKPAGGLPRMIEVVAAVKCKECGGEIPKGAPAMWLSGHWTKHPACVKGTKP